MLSLSPLPDSPRILAIAGGSCSGKSTLAAYLRDYVGPIPEALDFGLLRDNLLAFKRGEAVALPNYDFTTHQRRTPSEPRNPRPLIIVEGILLLGQPELRDIFDHSVFMRCAPELRLSRRLERDTTERSSSTKRNIFPI